MREGERLHSSTICIAHVLQGKWSFLSLVVAVAVAAAAVVVVASPSVVVSVISGCGGRGDDDGEEEENDDGGYGEKKKPGGDGKTTNARDAAEGGSLLSSSSSSLVILVCIVLPFLLPADCFTICLPPVFNALVNGWLLCWLPPTPQMTSAKSIDDRCTCHRRSSPSSSSSLLVASHQREDRPCGGLRMMTTAIATTKATDRPLNRQSPSHLVDVNITSSSPPHVGCFHPFSLCWWRRLFGMPTEVAPMPSRWQCVVAAGCSCA